MGQSLEPQPRHKIRTLLTLFTSKKTGTPERSSHGKIVVFCFRHSDPKRAGDGQALQYFVYLDSVGSNISSAAVFLWNFFSFGNLSKCFRPDLRVRFEGWPGVFSIHLFRIH